MIGAGAVIFLLALGLRLEMAQGLAGPLDNDSADYLIVAQNLAAGRGFVEDVVWNFRTRPKEVTHPSNDYWMPLTSILIAGSILLFGRSFFAAELPNLLLGAALPLIGMAIARELGGRRRYAVAAGVLLAFSQRLVFYAMDTDSVTAYAFFSGLTLLAAAKGSRGRPVWLALAGLFAGLTHLSRNDGSIWVLTLILVFALSRRDPENRRAPFRFWLLAAAGYLAVIGPWLIRNLTVFGAPLPPTSAKALLCHSYLDLYAFDKDLSLRAYLDQGPAEIIQGKLSALVSILGIIYRRSLLHPALAPFAVLGLWQVSSAGRRLVLGHLFLIILLWSLLMDAFIGPFGGPLRTAMGLVIYLAPVGALGLQQIEIWLQRLRPFPGWMIPALFLVVAALMNLHDPREYRRNARIVEFSRRDLAYFQKLGQVLQSASSAKPTVMIFRPWQLNLASELPALSIPSDGLEAVLSACRFYRVDFLVFGSDRKDDDPEYQQVAGYFKNLVQPDPALHRGKDSPLVPYLQIKNTWIFRVVLPGPEAKSGPGPNP